MAASLVDHNHNTTTIMRWTGHLIGVASAGFFALFAVAEIVDGIRNGSFDPQGVAPVSLILLAAVGVLLSFRWERGGGLLILIGGIGMGVLTLSLGGLDNLQVALIFTVPLGLAGVLSLLCASRATGD